MFPLSHMLKSFIRTGTLNVIDADGKTHIFGGTPGPEVTMRLTDPSLYKHAFLQSRARSRRSLHGRPHELRELDAPRLPHSLFGEPAVARILPAAEGAAQHLARLEGFQQSNPVGKAQKNVAHHYDIGNEFYRLFLDRGMHYSCAYFTNDDETLEEAQRTSCGSSPQSSI